MCFNFNNCFASKLKLAQAYIPYQELNKIYDLEKALYFGTIFPELNMPYDIKIKLKDKKNCFYDMSEENNNNNNSSGGI